MAARHLGRIAGWAVTCTVVPALLGAALGRRWIGLGAAVAVLATAWLVLWLPRAAHAAFERASYARAARRYRLL
ncbi:MAG TPA: hypothetical protein VFT22_22950, partial [Kofleriaceae bacterium]|nr:hypothetical protein [Kofleriaceae bacterium]